MKYIPANSNLVKDEAKFILACLQFRKMGYDFNWTKKSALDRNTDATWDGEWDGIHSENEGFGILVRKLLDK